VQSSVTVCHEREQLPQATLLHQAHHLLRDARLRAAKASASTDAPRPALTPEQLAATQALNTMQVNGMLNRRFGLRTPATSTPAGAAGGQPDDYFHQVQQDLMAGNFVGALGLLDTHWPASARDEAKARAFVGGAIVARLHATLVPLTMDRMLHALELLLPLRGHRYLDEVIMGGQRLRDLLLAAAHGLDHDRLTYALTVLDKGINALNGPQPHYLIGPPITRTQDISYFGDYEDVVAYLNAIYGKQATSEYEIQPLGDAGGIEKDIQIANAFFQLAAQDGVARAMASVGKDAVSFTAWWGNIGGTLLGPAVCLFPLEGVALPLLALGLAAAGAGLMAVTSVPTNQESFQSVLTNTIGAVGNNDIHTACGYVQNNTSTTAVSVFHKAKDPKNRWSGHRATLEALKTLFQAEFITITKGGLAQIDHDAVSNRVYRDLMLSVVPVKDVGRMIYEYTAQNALHGGGDDREYWVYNKPELWVCALDRTILNVPAQIQQPLSELLKGGNVAAVDLKTPAEIAINVSSAGVTGYYVRVGTNVKHDVEGVIPLAPWVHDDAHGNQVESSQAFGEQVKASVWRAAQGQPPRTQVDEVVGR